MIILKFNHSDDDNAYHVFRDEDHMLTCFSDSYDEVEYHSGKIVTLLFDGMYTHGTVIKPITHK